MKTYKPETVIQSIELLEEFLCTDLGQKNWSIKFLKKHFAICKGEIRKILNLEERRNK